MAILDKTNENKTFLKNILMIAFPIAMQNLLSQILTLIDNLMVGTLGEECISAVSVCTTFLWLSYTFNSGICGGASILCAQEYGRKNYSKIKNIFSISLVINLLINDIFFLILKYFPENILKIYSNVPELLIPGIEYYEIIKYSLICTAVTLSITNVLQSMKNVKLSFYNSLISCLCNIIFNWLFIFGNLGFPAMGVRGAALGTVLARIVEMSISIIYFLFIEKDLKFKISEFNLFLTKKELLTLIRVTVPILIMDVLMNLTSSAQTMITGRISKYYVTANSIVHTTYMLPNTFSVGLSVAAGIMIGNKIGENDNTKVQKEAERFVYASIVFGIINSIMLFCLFPIISDFYQVSSETLQLAKRMSLAAEFSVFFMPVSYILCNGVIKAKGNTSTLLRIDFLSNWLISIPIGFFFSFYLNCPAEYLYVILRLSYVIKGLWGIWQIRSKKWLCE